jgi:hypothetical protein
MFVYCNGPGSLSNIVGGPKLYLTIFSTSLSVEFFTFRGNQTIYPEYMFKQFSLPIDHEIYCRTAYYIREGVRAVTFTMILKILFII